MPHHQDTRDLPYSARQMFDLVADIESYPQFLPWNSAARIRSRETRPEGAEEIAADLVISFKVFRERFGSRVVLWPADPETGALKIDTEYLDGPFKYMRSGWIFTDRPGGGPAQPTQRNAGGNVTTWHRTPDEGTGSSSRRE